MKTTLLHWSLLFATLILPMQARCEELPVDLNKARQIFQRRQSGEKISADDQAYLKRAMASRGAGGVPSAPQPAWNGHLTPLTELGTAKYKGEDGGLYGGGRNEPPKEHLAVAMAESAKIQPLDAEGKPSKDGKIVLVSIGMSNTTMEYSVFKKLADADPQKSPHVVVVDGAMGARTGTAWALDGVDLLPAGEGDRLIKIMGGMGRKVTKGFGDTWTTVEERLKTAGVNARQVQANIGDILLIARHRYPNLRIAYLSSRIYGGYATTPLNPEPYAYEEAFSMRWLIQDQIAGKPALNYDSAHGEVKAPVVLWGPYLWADGTTPRKADGLIYAREDLSPGDGTHPEQSARTKVANLLLTFLKNDPTAKRWFTGKSAEVGAR
jgi:hypothetical protein